MELARCSTEVKGIGDRDEVPQMAKFHEPILILHEYYRAGRDWLRCHARGVTHTPARARFPVLHRAAKPSTHKVTASHLDGEG